MVRDTKNNGNGAGRLLSRLAGEKKKSITAVCLVLIMAFMWVRVFTKKAPPAAGAAVVDEAAAAEESDSQPNVSFIELPRIAGRNDIITRDFFAANGWKQFDRDKEGSNGIGIGEVNDPKTDGSEQVVERVTAKLKLGVIELGQNPYVYINNELLSVGDRLRVRDNGNTYDCEVTQIGVNEVSLKLEDTEIVLKLTQAVQQPD
ncbi:MAG: hypothetical protein JSU94_15370 [Phycisphaerales bacterium]|nr:MAG: hypothetical protein JSU94_15370 [Phycisphaerales bacterium]